MIELLLAAERMLEAGDLDHAERLFAQVAEADPRNAIAVVGLAEVAASRGDDAGALALARRALEIDPENAAARRMLGRSESVDAAVAEAAEAADTTEPALAGAPSASTLEARPVPAEVRRQRSLWARIRAYLGFG